MESALRVHPPFPGTLPSTLPSTLRALAGLIMVGSAGCAQGARTDRLDTDHDGWITPYDCDDADPLVSPDAVELCDGVDNNCDGVVDEEGALDAALFYDDRDGDGWGDAAASWRTCTAPDNTVARSGDCADGDATRNPDADELCDNQDNDCDGLIDESDAVDAPTWFLDADGDGYGSAGVYQDGCAQPSNYVALDTDCDDSDAEVHPGAVEICDPADVDEDCSGAADDDDVNADGLITWFLDQDGDGYGVSDDSLQSCEDQAGRAERDGDCDDGNDGVHPDAAELCADGVDNDCDGLTDGFDVDALGDVDLYVDADLDGFGDATAWVGSGCDLSTGISSRPTDCDDTDAAIHPDAVEIWYDGVDQDCAGDDDDDADADGVTAELAGGADCDDADPAVLPGALEVCVDGVDNDCDGAVDPCAPWSLAGVAGAGLGGALAAAGDIDGDGLGDLILGGELYGDSNQGAAFLLLGPILDGGWDASSLTTLTGDEAGQHAGASVAGVGDLDGDGLAELLVGAPQADLGGGMGSGGAWLLSGPVSGGQLSDLATALVVGEDSDDQAGSSVAAVGDVNDDGTPDLVIGAPNADPAGSRTGAAYLLLGPISGTVDLWFADAVWRGEDAGDQAGAVVSGAGDVDGDGLADVLIGAPQRRGDDTWAGAAYLATGGDDLSASGLSLDSVTARLLGTAGSDQAGASVAAAGDVNGDGYGDVLVGAPQRDLGGSGSGAAYLLLGPLSGDRELSTADLVLMGATAEDLAGSAVVGDFDLDGDGRVDLGVGARSDDAGGSDAGALYVVLAPDSGSLSLDEADLRIQGDSVDLGLGGAAAAGDVTGDGLDDLLLGLPKADAGAGGAWVISGW